MATLIIDNNYAVKSVVNVETDLHLLTATHQKKCVLPECFLKKRQKGIRIHFPAPALPAHFVSITHTKSSIFSPLELDPSPVVHTADPSCQHCSNTSLTTPFRKVLLTGGICLLTGPRGLSQLRSNQLLRYMSHKKVICVSGLILLLLLCNLHGRPLKELVNDQDQKHLWAAIAMYPL